MTNKFQTYFRRTGKAILSLTCTAILTLSCTQLTLASEKNNSLSDSTGSNGSDASISTVIGAEAAQNFAFADAGVDPLSVEVVNTEYDYDNGEFLYEVDFTVEDTEYEYQIQAYDGSVLKKSIEYLGRKETISRQTETDTTTTITLEEAKELALADTELTDEELELVTFTKEENDEDDGISVYDIEFYTDTAKYEYEISILTGDVLELSTDYRFTTQDLANNTDTERDGAGSTDNGTSGNTNSSSSGNTNSSSSENTDSSNNTGDTGSSSTSYISLDDAKAIALKYAGLSDSDVTFKKAKLDKEHGTMVYEIEFYQGRTEYECEINAVTGTIIEFEIDD